jgi:hypothetical protein
MYDIIEQFKKKSPDYDSVYYESIVQRFAVVGGDKGREDEKQKKGKFFSNVYELYIYLAFLGISKNHAIPFITGAKRNHFIKMNEWTQHRELLHFLIMALLTKSAVDFNALENMDSKGIDDFLTQLKRDLEEYANGGFELLHQKMKEDPDYFKDDNCFINLLSDM